MKISETPKATPNSAATDPAQTVTLITINDFESKILSNHRTVDIFLPPGYKTAISTRYKVLYANDGQDMNALKLKSNLEDLYSNNSIEKIIVVAVYASARLDEYGTAGVANSQKQGSKAAEYEQFLTTELLPYIDLNYRTQTGAEDTAIMGSSLGGLSAFDLAWQHPELFGKVGVFSGSFWWRTDDRSVKTKQSSRIMHKIVRQSPKRDGLKMWFEAGTLDETADRDGNGIIDAIQDTTELMDELKLKGYQTGPDMVYLQVEGGTHSPATWAKVLPDFLKWAFPNQAS